MIVSCSLGQVVDWAQVQPFHQLPDFFDDYPLLRVVNSAYQPNLQIDEQEGEPTTPLNQFPHQVSATNFRKINRAYKFKCKKPIFFFPIC